MAEEAGLGADAARGREAVLASGVQVPSEADRIVAPTLQAAYQSAVRGRQQIDAVSVEIELPSRISSLSLWTPRRVRRPSPDFWRPRREKSHESSRGLPRSPESLAEIAHRAGLTKSTFFRYFPDKREVLSAGQETLSQLLVNGISAAPAGATPLAAVAAGLERAAGAMTPFNRELAPRLKAVIAASAELQERDALKQVGLAAAMADALRAHGVPDRSANLAAELGVLAFKEAYAKWVAAENEQSLGEFAREALTDLRTAATE